MTVAITELRRRLGNATDALENAAQRAAAGEAAASTEVELHAEAVRTYSDVLAAVDTGNDRPYANGTHSFFRDAYKRSVDGDLEARTRIDSDADHRGSVMADFQGLVVPASVARLADGGHSRRPTVDLLAEPLPATGSPAYAAKVTTAGSAEVQSAEGTAPTPVNIATDLLDMGIETLVSAAVMSLQAVNRMEAAAFDRLVAAEVLAPLNALQESATITALLTQTGGGTLSITSTSPTDLLNSLARASAASAETAGAAPDYVVMAPRRWRWLLAGAGDRGAALTPTTCLGMTVVESTAVPLTESTNEDRIIVGRRDDTLLYESPAAVKISQDASGMGENLNARINAYRYMTLPVSLRPAALVVLSGAGLANPYA